MAWSLLLRGGSVVDGSGAPARRADVAVEGERIAAVAPSLAGQADRVIDATGKVVSPGFIDMHSHSDLFYFACPSAESKVRQGVTLELAGNCGSSFCAPLQGMTHELLQSRVSQYTETFTPTWSDFGGYPTGVAHVAVNGVLVVENGSFTGHTPGKVIRNFGD